MFLISSQYLRRWLMNARYEMLVGLYPPSQLRQMQSVRDALLDDPTSLDNRHTPVENNDGNEQEASG